MGLTILQERHRAGFTQLDPEEAGYVWNQVTNRWKSDIRRYFSSREVQYVPVSGSELFDLCRDIGLDQCRVILAFAGQNGRARPIIEKLMGHAIVPWAETVEASTAESGGSHTSWGWGTGQRVGGGGDAAQGAVRVYNHPLRMVGTDTRLQKRVDTRIVRSVIENPHRIGSEMHGRYQHWIVGDTVDACIKRGLTTRSVRRDVRHGNVTLQGVEPQEPRYGKGRTKANDEGRKAHIEKTTMSSMEPKS